jgi:hypothetical protein
MEPLVMVSGALLFYYIYQSVIDTLKDLRKEKGRHFIGMLVHVKVRTRDHAYNESYMTTRNRW